MLEAEGVEFRANGTLDLGRYRWVPAARARVAARGPKRRGSRRRRAG